MRTAIVIPILLALSACEDDRRASHRDRYDDDSHSYGGLGMPRHKRDLLDDKLNKIDDDLLQLKKKLDPTSTGAWECDELIRLTTCAYDKTSGVSDAAKQALQDGIQAWRDALSSSATHDATLEACKTSLEAGRSGFSAMGCY